jgi:hypothetical protein
MCATCGHGDFPQNASLFWSSISADMGRSETLHGIRFCTFGMEIAAIMILSAKLLVRLTAV